MCAITLGILRNDIRRRFALRSDELVEMVKLGIFVVFGSLLTLDGLFGDGWAAVGIVAFTLLVARPVAVWHGARRDPDRRAHASAFMAWFGPKGVATMAFSLLVLGQAVPGADRIFNLAALAVFMLDHRPRADGHPGRELDRPRQRAPPGPRAPYACRAACSWAVGKAETARVRRSVRKLNRSWAGGRSPSGELGRKVAQGSPDHRAQSVAVEEAVVTRHLAARAAALRHLSEVPPRGVSVSVVRHQRSKQTRPGQCNVPNRKHATFLLGRTSS